MTLQHPMTAQRVWDERKSTKRPISKIVLKYPHERVRMYPSRIVYTFDDDSTLETHGRGKTQMVLVLPP